MLPAGVTFESKVTKTSPQPLHRYTKYALLHLLYVTHDEYLVVIVQQNLLEILDVMLLMFYRYLAVHMTYQRAITWKHDVELSEQTNRQTDKQSNRHTHHNTSHPSLGQRNDNYTISFQRHLERRRADPRSVSTDWMRERVALWGVGGLLTLSCSSAFINPDPPPRSFHSNTNLTTDKQHQLQQNHLR